MKTILTAAAIACTTFAQAEEIELGFHDGHRVWMKVIEYASQNEYRYATVRVAVTTDDHAVLFGVYISCDEGTSQRLMTFVGDTLDTMEKVNGEEPPAPIKHGSVVERAARIACD